MESDKLLEVTKALRLEVIKILYTYDLTNDNRALEALTAIDDMFERLDVAVEDVIPEDMMHSYFEGIDNAGLLMSEAGVSVAGGLQASISSSGKIASAFKTQAHLDAIAEVTDDLMIDMKSAIRTAKQNAYFTLKTTLAEVKEELQSGMIRGNSREEITKRVAESFANEGMHCFTTIDNRKLSLDFYSEVVTRTSLKKANIEGSLNRYKSNGVKHVTVTGGTPTCHQCYSYRGIVFSLVDDNGDFPYLPPNTFPLHPNCNCSLHPYVIEYKTDDEIESDKKKASNFDPDKDTRSKSQQEAYERKQRINRINNYEKKRYAEIRAVLGDKDVPKTLGGFKRSKRSNSDNYKKLLRRYKNVKGSMES